MATQRTIYEVQVRFLNQGAVRGAKGLSRSFGMASKSAFGLNRALTLLAGGGAGLIVFNRAKRALIDYNAEIQVARNSIAALIQIGEKETPLEAAMQRSRVLVKQFQEDARKSLGTTQDFLRFSKDVSGAARAGGATDEQFRGLVKGGVVASQALGIRADVASRDIAQMLQGQVTIRDRLARILLRGINVERDAFNKIARADPAKALELTLKALNQPAIKNAAQLFEKSFAGVASTLKDNIQIALGKVGLPLMKALTAEFSKINKFFDNNQASVNKFITDASTTLVDGFKLVRDVIGFIVENKELLLSLAKAWLIFKGVGAISGGIMAAGNAAQSLSAGAAAAGGASRFAMALSRVNMGVQIVGVTAAAASALAIAVDRAQEKSLRKAADTAFITKISRDFNRGKFDKRDGKLAARLIAGAPRFGVGIGSIDQALKISAGAGVLRQASRQGLAGSGKAFANELINQFNLGGGIGALKSGGSLEGMLAALTKRSGGILSTGTLPITGRKEQAAEFIRARIAAERDAARLFVDTLAGLWWNRFHDQALLPSFAQLFANIPGFIAGALNKLDKETEKENKKRSKPPSVKANVTVVSNDPDRFAFQMVEAFDDLAKNRTQALRIKR